MGLNIKEKISRLVKLHKTTITNVLIILVLGLLSLSWFRGNNLIGGGDFGLSLDWLASFKSMFTVWNENYSLGAADFRSIAQIFPYVFLGAILEKIGFSLIFIEKLFFYFWFVSGGLSMYLLCTVLGQRKKGRIMASFLYMLNPFSLMIIWRVSHAQIQVPYSFAPLYLALFVYGFSNKKGIGYVFASVMLWFATSTTAYAWPAAAVIHWIPLLFYVLTVSIFSKHERVHIIKYFLSFVFLWLIVNFYWIFPFAYSLSESIASSQSPVILSDIETLKLTSVKVLNSIRFTGFWSLHSGYKGEPYYPYENYYNLFFINLISWITPILVLIGFIFRYKKSRIFFLFFLLVTIFGVFGMKGPYPPLGGIAVWIYQKIPSLALLTRFTFLFYGIPTFIIFSVLFADGFTLLEEKIEKKAKKLVLSFDILIFSLLMVILVFPFWNGEVIKKQTILFPGERFKIPQYWFDAKTWLNNQSDYFRILPLPMSQTYNMANYWGEGYSGGDLARWFSNHPFINTGTVPGFDLAKTLGDAIEKNNDSPSLSRLLAYMNSKYLLVRNDTRWDFIKGHDWWFDHSQNKINNFISKQIDLSLDKKIGELVFYKLNDKMLLPHFYTPNSLKFYSGEIKGLSEFSQFLHPEEKDSFMVMEQNLNTLMSSSEKNDQIWKYFGKYLISSFPSSFRDGQNLKRVFAEYKFSLPKSGKYKIYLNNDRFFKYYEHKNSLEMKIDQNNTESYLITTSDDSIYLGEFYLNEGDHQIIFHLPENKNLFQNSSFEENILKEQLSEDAYLGSNSLKINLTKTENFISFPSVQHDSGKSYQISFALKNLKGQFPNLLIWENLSDSPNPNFNYEQNRFGIKNIETIYQTYNFQGDNQWKKYDLLYRPKVYTKSFGFSFIFWPTGNIIPEISGNLLDDVSVYREYDNCLLLESVENNSLSFKNPKLSIKKLNSYKYLIVVEDAIEPFWLIFSEAYHPKWKNSVSSQHFKINGFANAWKVDKLGSYSIVVEFTLQSVYKISLFVSLSSIIISLVIFIFFKKGLLKRKIRL